MLEAQKLSYAYNVDGKMGRLVLDELDLKIEKGRFVAILGHNGSGKSTLARHFNAIFLPMGGKMYVMGMDSSDEKNVFPIRENVGMVFQNPDNQIVTAVVEEEVAFAPENLGVEPYKIRQRVDKALEIVGMSEYKKASPANLSGGQKQRLAIASALAMEPECLVLDEPTAMLDPKGRTEIISTIKRLNKEKNLTVVLITHYMEEAAQADRVVVMQEGKIVLDDTPKKVFSKVEKIKQIGLDVPQVNELFYQLKKRGFSLPDDIITTEEAAKELFKLLEGKQK